MAIGIRPIRPVTAGENRQRRSHVLAPIRVAVSLADGSGRVHGWARDLSEGGMYIRTSTHFREGAEVSIEALIREGDSVFRLRTGGWVARVGQDGMGIQLANLSNENREAIQRLLKRVN